MERIADRLQWESVRFSAGGTMNETDRAAVLTSIDALTGQEQQSDQNANSILQQPTGTHIARQTHRFWEAIAIVAGIVLMLHAGLSLRLDNQIFMFRAFSWAELIIGLGTVIVDAWFLTNI
jgi:hypothetical protein